MASLKDWDIIKLSTLITNVDAKLSASTRTDRGYQILCLVRRNDQILFRYIDEKGEVHLMLLCWFAENQKCIQDVCFDNSESWLLVFCYDNTLHIVPALSICDKSATVEPTFTRDEITSFIVPFIGPHECPNPQTCPNNSHNVSSAPQSHRSSIASETSVRSSLSGSELGAASGLKRSESMHTTHKIDEIFSLNSIYNQLHGTEGQQSTAQDPITPIAMKTIENFFAEGKDDRMGASGMDTKASTPQECFSHTISSSIESTVSVSCPYPTCCSWWETLTNEPRAILGYSDGSICVVALTPNCPFLGNTNCERGSIEKLIICQDNSMETISLMINTSTKEQWKLLLEQKSIKYTFPGDISPSSSQELKEEMLKSLGDGEKPNSGLMDDWQIVLSLPKEGSGSGGDQGTDSGGEKGSSPSGSEPQSSDDFEKVEGECSTEDGKTDARDQQGALPKLFPAARARLMSLRDLGAKKIGTLKLKLSESRIKAKEKERIKEQAANLAVMELPGMYPEILTTPAGPYFVVQYLNGKYLLSALHSYSDTLSVHSMDISLIPLHIYKVPKQCKSTVLTRNVIYVTHHLSLGSERTTESTNSSPDANPETVGDLSEQPRRNTDSSIENLGSSQSQTQDEDASTETTNLGTVNAVSVVSCQLAAVKMGDDCDFNEHAMLALFQFPDEKILEIHRISPLGDGSEAKDPDDTRFNAPDESGDVRSVFQKSSVSNYLKMQRILRMDKKLETHESQVMVGEFPKVEFDRAAIVTDKNLYSLELNDTARNLFLKLAHKSLWAACEDFCLTFGLPLATCVEYAGDVLLKRKRITEALMTYNVARLSPMKTALKLASVNENGALMKLCSMALRNSHIINSQFVMHDVMRILVDEAHLGNVVYDSLMNLNAKVSLKPINAGAQCSDFSYENDDVSWDVQISTTAQFHLSNLMLLTLCERCVQDKNYIPLWNFIVTNSKYHTSLACIVLAHGKLYSSVILLAMVRGTCLDVFSWLIGIWEQLIDHPAEMNAYVYNLSNELFMESLIYLQEYTIQYFEMIRKCLEKFDINVLERLIRQLNPFHPIYRPLMHKLSNHDSSSGRELDNGLLLFCKCLIETFLAVSIRLQMLKMHNGSFLNALKHVRVFYDEKPVEMRLKQHSPLSAGFSHAGCVMNRVAYLWGSNGVNCALSRTSLQGDPLTPNGSPPTAFFLKQLDLEVLAVQCGRLHTLLLTNNGVYSMGANNLGQLGIGNHVLNALQPMYVQSLDGMNITHICAGQYHNAVVANGLLYTWGWGIFGQLGHGSVADCSKPTIVEFFRKKNIQQIALGHAHTLVICRQECNTKNVLYVFGSNHYGQLGLGQEDKFNFTVDTRNGKSFVLSLIPRRVDFDEEILLINTKLFVNLVLTKSNKLYTWGASPQALRLANQARKRARSSHKCRPNVMTPAATAGPSTSPPSAEPESKTDGTEPESKSSTVSNAPEEPKEEQQPKIEPEVEQQPVEGVDETPKTPNGGPVPDIKIEDTSAGEESKTPDVDEKAATPGEEFAEHLFPSLVDTTLVQDDIVRISSGLYHFALVTSRSQIYTWGKNIERQLGREGGRNEVLIPTKLDTVTGVEYVECGADFTLIMTEDGVVKSWGNNNMGQCAKEINQERSGVPGKLVRLPISNRLVRIPDSSQFIELPHEIKLPPSDGSHEPSNQTLRLIKSMPKFRRNFVVKSTLEKVISNNISTISSSLNDVSNTTEMDDFVGELRTAFDCRIQNQNASTMSSLQSVSYATSPTSMAVDDDEDDEGLEDMDQDDRSSESSRLCNERHLLSNDFIHYCLYIFHGLYSQDNILELTKRCNEYHIRMMMLNYDYVEAFHLILELLSGSLSSSASPVTVAKTTMNLVKIFEYFTKDSNIIPMDTSNFKYFIYELFMFFIKHNINLDVLEEYFLRNLEYYLVQLAFVLYFSNTNNISAGLRGNVDSETLEMERRLLDKFNNNGNNLLAAEAFGPSSPQSTGKVVRKLENTETISKALSTKFSVMLCQKLMEYFERFK